ncbi:MAG: hypothetical protein ACPHVL_02420 [Psychroflexus salarius]
MSKMLHNIDLKALATCFPDTADCISIPEQTASDLAFVAATSILKNEKIDVDKIGGVVFLSSTPDYRSPATAMVLQSRLKLSTDLIAFDVNVSGNAFNTGIQLASSILNSSNTEYVLVLYGETKSKQVVSTQIKLNEADYGSAVLVGKSDKDSMHFFNYTASDKKDAILVKEGGYKDARPQGANMPYSGLNHMGTLKINLDDVLGFQHEVAKSSVCKEFIDKEAAYIISNFDLEVLNQINSENKSLKISDVNTHKNKWGIAPQLQLQKILVNQENESIPILSLTYGEGLSSTGLYFNVVNSIFSSTLKSNIVFEDADVSHEI